MQDATLKDLGWSHFFQQQLSLEEWESTLPVRVFSLNRHLLDGVGSQGRYQFALPPSWLKLPAEELPTVGDWVLLDSDQNPLKVLQRTSLFKRMASGRDTRVQLMAANVDTLFIVTSCNQDYNPSRLERYLAMALDAGVEPVIVLTKADLTDASRDYTKQAGSLHPGVEVVVVDSRSDDSVKKLARWCVSGRTVALVGSSGVGKSTLVNTLSSSAVQETGRVRFGDAKGRHTTTGRSLHLLPAGGLLMDSPGLRELQLSDCEDGVATLFMEIESFARDCRFNDCRHEGEAGCAVATALEQGQIEERRLENYLKLRTEQERTEQTLVEKRRKDRSFGKMVKRAKALKHKEKG